MEASIVQSSKVDDGSNSKGNIFEDNPEEDIWGDDSDENSNSGSSLRREWISRHNRFHTMGYREGITEGKEASAQEGFNVGFRQAVRVGKKWGLVRGITSAISCLPESSVEKLVPDIEIRERLKEIQKAVQAISSDNALKLYHDTIQKSDSLRSMDCGDHCEEIFGFKVESASNKLDSHYKDLLQLLSNCPEIKVGEKLGIGND
ncbi:putative tRNA 2'-phosphotransferase isoform X2 [Carex littledalei]|uniref:Putative tRNA 2'-phosphotransferase isoform X2 n=1 Tax=Carex littledalei TaxID=544730 RepID=A0A833VEM6_9POAL|nr:putative tRNA 2'-phosphotransferase isoform X2 [Carex littledalei]